MRARTRTHARRHACIYSFLKLTIKNMPLRVDIGMRLPRFEYAFLILSDITHLARANDFIYNPKIW